MTYYGIISMNNNIFNDITPEEVINKLRSMGIEFNKKQFLKDVKAFYSADDISHHWRKKYTIFVEENWEDDFIWEAALFLWEKFAPQIVNTEKLDDMMQEGYELIEEKKYIEGTELWLDVWEHLRKRFTPDMESISEAEVVFPGMMQSLYNWCQDVEVALENAGSEDPSFYKKRIEYCNTFCSLFPESNELIIHNMKRAEADSYFHLGETRKGDELFEKMIDDFPDSVWGYLGWGDMYGVMRLNEKVPIDYKKANKIYRDGLKKVKDHNERKYLMERLESLEKMKKREDKTKKS
jgi:tetratricopeptide (TPR) repeat protein